MKKNDPPVIPSDRSDDLHNLELANDCDLVCFMAGNQFMLMDELMNAFQRAFPEVERIFYETLPPGLELKQILSGGAEFRGRLIDARPDVYTSVNEKSMAVLVENGHIQPGEYQLYLHNRLALMTPPGNPAGIASIEDLAGDHVRISQPDPENEDIAFHIMDMYRQAGGEKLVHRIMEEKRAEGSTIFTIVHHRETPLRIQKRTVDVGPVWATEIIQARRAGLDIDVVEPGEELDQRDHINYYACKLARAPHPENASRFLDFITSPRGRGIYEKYGFQPHV